MIIKILHTITAGLLILEKENERNNNNDTKKKKNKKEKYNRSTDTMREFNMRMHRM